MKNLSWIWLGVLGLSLSMGGCGDDDPSGVELAQSDIDAFAQMNSAGARSFDQKTNGLFTKIFGSTEGPEVRKFFEERIRHVIDEDTPVYVSPKRFAQESWTKDPSSEEIMKEKQVKITASNLSMPLWLQSQFAETPITVQFNSVTLPMTTSRNGIMIVGEGYQASETYQGETIDLPISYRQGVLLHESRHSDCTGGLTPNSIRIARSSTSYRSFTQDFDRKSCGHHHTYCPPGHRLADLPACDDHAWGAYAIEAVFLQAMSLELADETEKHILLISAYDNVSRLKLSYSAMVQRAYGEPDMSSTNAVIPETTP